jgi:hypothetical protein
VNNNLQQEASAVRVFGAGTGRMFALRFVNPTQLVSWVKEHPQPA